MVYVFLIFLHKLMVCCDWFWQLWSLQKQNWQSTFTQATSGYSIPQHRCESSHVSGRARTEKKNTMFHWVPLLTFALSHCLWCAWLCYICTWPFPTCCDWCHDKSHWQLCIGSASKVDHRLKTCAELLLMINVYCLHIYGPYQCSSGPHFCTHLLTHPSWLGSSPCGSFQTRGMFGQYQKKKNLRLLNFPFHVT